MDPKPEVGAKLGIGPALGVAREPDVDPDLGIATEPCAADTAGEGRSGEPTAGQRDEPELLRRRNDESNGCNLNISGCRIQNLSHETRKLTTDHVTWHALTPGVPDVERAGCRTR
ncbi:hypothetical protein [Streptomyces sp. NPDC014685]|uniref:hypothetical protein n=1 Tax=Streptomyces sp. NPDC014685 TaxID=3364881 RepID=UPI0036FEBDAF